MELFEDWRYELSAQMTPFRFQILISFYFEPAGCKHVLMF